MEDAGDYNLEIIRTEAEFHALAKDWRRLYEESHPRNPFLSYEWTAACWSRLCEGCTPFIVTAREGGRLVGVAPLRLERQAGFRVLRFMGNLWSDYLGFLYSPAHSGVERVLLEELADARDEWDVAILRQLASEYTWIEDAPLPGGLRDQHTNGSVAPYLKHEGDWESLCKAGPYWLREMKKAGRRFEREGGRIVCFTGEEAASRIDEIVQVEACSWKARYGEPSFQTGPGAALVREAFSRFGEDGEMGVWMAYMGDEPVAFQITFTTAEKIGLYLCAYNEEYRRYSAGALVMYRAIEAAWNAGAREYDFLNGDEPYKLERTDAVRPLRFRALYPANARGVLAFACLVAPRWWLKDCAPAYNAFHAWIRFRENPSGTLRHVLQSLKSLRRTAELRGGKALG